MTRALLFSDVDGTLLDASGRYAMSREELAPHLHRISVVLASSRTLLELSRNQMALGLEGPLVAENGAVTGLPWLESLSSWGPREVIDGRAWCVMERGSRATVIREAITAESAVTGIACRDQADSEPELGRRCSVLLKPVVGDTMNALASLAARLEARGFSASSGGSWLAVTDGADKGHGVRAVLEYQRTFAQAPALVAAVGDGDNDVALLLAADRRYVIARDDGSYHEALSMLPRVERVATAGVAGWREVIATLSDGREG